MSSWSVHKFGGTSVGSAMCIRKCHDIVKSHCCKQRLAVVVSGMGGKPKVTDLLLELVHAAALRNHDEIVSKMDLIRNKHRECIVDLLGESSSSALSIMALIEADLKDISDLIRAVMLMKTAHEQILELVSGYGEIWSATIFSALLNKEGLPFKFLNARDVLIVNDDNKVLWEESEKRLSLFMSQAEAEYASGPSLLHPQSIKLPHLLITGYVASTIDGVATTLKRDGSDYSASIFGRMLRSSAITIWTDVSGVYSADPRRVPEAQILPDVSYTEAVELAYFGAKVIHPKTMEPAIELKIPIYIRNTFEPHLSGTRIYLPTKEVKVRERSVCGFTTVDGISLLNIEATGMIGVPGVAHRLFGALSTYNISVMFIAQASAEHSICFATHSVYADRACEAVKHAFFYELKSGYISAIRVIGDCSIIAAVGESMCHMPGVAGLFFGALGDASISVLSISQGCDERNIAAVVRTRDATRALRAVHSAFWLSSLELSIGIVGTGRVGSALLQSLLANLAVLEARLGLRVKIRGIANSRKMLLGEDLTGSLRDILSYFASTRMSTSNSIAGTSTCTRACAGVNVSSSPSIGGEIPASPNDVMTSGIDGDHVTTDGSPRNPNFTIATVADTANVTNTTPMRSTSIHNMLFKTTTTPAAAAAAASKEGTGTGAGGAGGMQKPRSYSTGGSGGSGGSGAGSRSGSFEVRKSESSRSLQELEIAMSDAGDDKAETDLDAFLQHVKAGTTPHTVIVDASTSYEVSARHPSWLRARAHIVTANKRALSSGLDLYNALYSEVRASHHNYMSEVTIGASLPIRTTLNDILCSGDAVHAIVGLMSVSANMVISGICEEGLTFTDSLLRTYNQRIFEDDTFSDLEGVDAAEKLLILARELGYPLNLQDIHIEPLAMRRVIDDWDAVTDEFAQEDARLQERARQAASRGCTLRYVQRIECNPPAELGGRFTLCKSHVKVSVKLEEVALGSEHAMVKGPLYHFSFHTDRYSQAPLTVQGPLSDPANTASGIVGDILRIARSVGAKDRGPQALAAAMEG